MHDPKSQHNILNMGIQMCSRDSLKFFYLIFLALISMPKPFDILFLIYEI